MQDIRERDMIGIVALIWPEPLLIGKLMSTPARNRPTMAIVGGKADASLEMAWTNTSRLLLFVMITAIVRAKHMTSAP